MIMSDETKVEAQGGGNGGLIARLGAKNSRLRAANRAMSTELDELKAGNAALGQQVEQLRAGADPNGLASRVKELEGEIRNRDHRAVFDKAARAAGVRAEGLDDLWSLSGYKPEADVVDEAAIGRVIDEQKGKRGYLFAPPQPAAGDPAPAPAPAPPKPGPAAGKGGASATGAPQVSEDLLKSDPVYVMKNYARVVEAARANVAAGIS
jgi:hypothetical protein